MHLKQISLNPLKRVGWTITSFRNIYSKFSKFFTALVYQNINPEKTSFSSINKYLYSNNITAKQYLILVNAYKYKNKFDLHRIEKLIINHKEFQAKKEKFQKYLRTDMLIKININFLEKKRIEEFKLSSEDFGFFVIPLLLRQLEYTNNDIINQDMDSIHEKIWKIIDFYSNTEEISYIPANRSKLFLVNYQ